MAKMETIIYLVRHAEINYIPDDYSRPLSEKGLQDVLKVTERFKDFKVSKVVSSPYLRAINTVKGVAEEKGLTIELINDFRERKVAKAHIEDFDSFATRQWQDFDFCLEEGESLSVTQSRGIKALENLVEQYSGESIVVGTHGTMLGVILNYYNKSHDYNFWKSIKMPDIFKFTFIDKTLVDITHITV